MDETGLVKGFGENDLIVRYSSKRVVTKKYPNFYTWIIFVEYISIIGWALSLLILFKDKII